jgi:hypothetical protein
VNEKRVKYYWVDLLLGLAIHELGYWSGKAGQNPWRGYDFVDTFRHRRVNSILLLHLSSCNPHSTQCELLVFDQDFHVQEHQAQSVAIISTALHHAGRRPTPETLALATWATFSKMNTRA